MKKFNPPEKSPVLTIISESIKRRKGEILEEIENDEQKSDFISD